MQMCVGKTLDPRRLPVIREVPCFIQEAIPCLILHLAMPAHLRFAIA